VIDIESNTPSTNINVWLELGADPCARDSKGYSALYHAYGRESLIELIVEHGGSIDSIVDAHGNTLLHYAVNNLEVLEEYLGSFSPNVNINNKDGHTSTQSVL
jgi:ankyrin repeat protein